MPLGFERLNERVTRPNALVNFIKPLDGPDKALAQDFLERVAAISYPIMKADHIAVMSLEEYPPNREFVGRNFNAGEVIQLVLKSPGTGQWLPFKYVQGVMMHELAHCKQMNHSKFFWQVKNAYSAELRALWEKGYSGEGLWGRGQTLLSGRYTTDRMPDTEGEVRSLCGGTYRSARGRKRKRGGEKEKPKLSYAERQQKRIAKKFGTKGVALGDDVSVKATLEGGKRNVAPPKVASSKRGRELRAQAALARFEQVKTPVKGEPTSGSETDSDYDDGDVGPEAMDARGNRILDGKGNGMVKICEDEDPADEDARREMEELRGLYQPKLSKFGISRSKAKVEKATPPAERSTTIKIEDSSTESEDEVGITNRPAREATKSAAKRVMPIVQARPPGPDTKSLQLPAAQSSPPTASRLAPQIPSASCPICSLENESATARCMACSHVLDTRKIPNVWQCQSTSCKGSQYLNAGDCGICGLCGTSKSESLARV
ncbi:hypothetical protein M8818_000121 [Zalaria obscura]|uniref:Uncharacterized protein n=1 Tax=Zalaria obscura TaxID=2024903 RepID=A0ACC3SQ74_9PEZI